MLLLKEKNLLLHNNLKTDRMDFLNIKEVIKKRGHTYETFAEQIGMTKTSVARIVSGRQTPSFDMLNKMANVLNVEVKDLFKYKRGGNSPYGFIEYQGSVHTIKSIEDLESLLKLVSK